MPVYEYECPKCGILEILHPMKAIIPDICVNCGSDIKRIFSSTPVHFKGNGWTKKDGSDGK